MKFLIRIYTCDIPLNFFHKILRVLSSVRHFFSVAHDTPLNFFHKILRVLSSDRHFFSVARDTIKAPGATLPLRATENGFHQVAQISIGAAAACDRDSLFLSAHHTHTKKLKQLFRIAS
jgi:hypothetical protein